MLWGLHEVEGGRAACVLPDRDTRTRAGARCRLTLPSVARGAGSGTGVSHGGSGIKGAAARCWAMCGPSVPALWHQPGSEGSRSRRVRGWQQVAAGAEAVPRSKRDGTEASGRRGARPPPGGAVGTGLLCPAPPWSLSVAPAAAAPRRGLRSAAAAWGSSAGRTLPPGWAAPAPSWAQGRALPRPLAVRLDPPDALGCCPDSGWALGHPRSGAPAPCPEAAALGGSRHGNQLVKEPFSLPRKPGLVSPQPRLLMLQGAQMLSQTHRGAIGMAVGGQLWRGLALGERRLQRAHHCGHTTAGTLSWAADVHVGCQGRALTQDIRHRGTHVKGSSSGSGRGPSLL